MSADDENVNWTSAIDDCEDKSVGHAGPVKLIGGMPVGQYLENGGGYFDIEDINLRDVVHSDEEDDEKELQKKMVARHLAWDECPPGLINVRRPVPTAREHLDSYEIIESRMTDVKYDIDGETPLKPGAIKKRVTLSGFGKRARMGDLVWVNYKLFLEQADEPFDDTMVHGSPKRFIVGNGEVIGGLEIAVVGMKTGQINHLLISHEYAFGVLGIVPRVPKEARILMYVQLVRIHDGHSELPVEELSPEERMERGFDAIFTAAQRRKTIGNDLLISRDTDGAIKEYFKAQELASELMPITDQESFKRCTLEYALQINLAKVYLETNKFRKAVLRCQEALKTPIPENQKTKAYYRLAKALFEMGKAEDALEPITVTYKMNGADPDVKQLYQDITAEVTKRKVAERETAKKMFQNMKL